MPTLSECLQEAGGFPFVATSVEKTVEVVGRRKSGQFGGYSLRDEEYSVGWCMSHNSWKLIKEPLRWEGEMLAYDEGLRVIDLFDWPDCMAGKRFKVTLEEIEG